MQYIPNLKHFKIKHFEKNKVNWLCVCCLRYTLINHKNHQRSDLCDLLVRSVYHSTDSISYFGPKTWKIIVFGLKQILSTNLNNK